MIQFVDKQFIMDMNVGAGAIVIDADVQGAWEYGDHEQMKYAFPRAYAIYKRMCLAGLARVGSAMVVEDSGYKVVILLTKKHRKDPKDLVLSNFTLALDDMVRKISSDVFIYSSILGRQDHCFTEMLEKIYKVCREINGSLGYNWFVYNKKGTTSA